MSGSPRIKPKLRPYPGPAGGWGSARSVAEILLREHIPTKGSSTLRHQNRADGYMCVSCAWAKPAKTHPLEFCENGAKATAWEITDRRAGPEFFAKYTLTELEGWLDHDLEEQGRLTHPMKWDRDQDKYLPVSWEQAFSEIGAHLRSSDPKRTVFYTSGRASLEAAYMYQLFARLFGSNNLPDCSNMCHESTSVGLPESIGASIGTASLSDFENCDCIFYIAQNVGTSSPRMLHDLQDAVDRGAKIVTFNFLHERGLERFTNPQSPSQMLTGDETKISSTFYQVRNGGDIAALYGVCKALIEADDAYHAGHAKHVAGDDGKPDHPTEADEVAFAASMASHDTKHVLDHSFIADHTAGFEAFAKSARALDWNELERISGLTRNQMQEAAQIYANAKNVLFVYGMGLTQHVMGVQNVHMLANLALLRGNVGKPGGNICAVRGHSNVQGQRTVGITEKPGLVPLDKLAELYHFEPPRWTGFTTVEACQAMLDDGLDALMCLGGNLLRAVPETEALEAHKGLTGLVKSRKITVVEGEGRLVARNAVEVDGTRYEATKAVVLATGSYSRSLPGLDVDGERIITSEHALRLDRVPQSVIVLGGGVIGVEFASVWKSFGADVTIIEALPHLLPLEEESSSKLLERAFRKRGITFSLGKKFSEAKTTDSGVTVTLEDGTTYDAELLLVAVGRGPVSEGLGYEEAGIEVERGFVKVDAHCQTNVPNVYAIGDLRPGLQLAHVGFAEGIMVAERIAGLNPPAIDYDGVPRITYCEPEVASVGITAAQAKERGYDVVEFTYDLAGNGRAQILQTAGACKVVAAKDGPVLGVHMVGSRVGDLIAEAQLITNWEALPVEVAQLIHPHPTLSEAVGEAHLALAGKPLHVHG